MTCLSSCLPEANVVGRVVLDEPVVQSSASLESTLQYQPHLPNCRCGATAFIRMGQATPPRTRPRPPRRPARARRRVRNLPYMAAPSAVQHNPDLARVRRHAQADRARQHAAEGGPRSAPGGPPRRAPKHDVPPLRTRRHAPAIARRVGPAMSGCCARPDIAGPRSLPVFTQAFARISPSLPT